MRTLVDTQHIEKRIYHYDTIDEWNNDFNVMTKQGWKDEENYYDYKYAKYVQVYNKEID